MGNPKSSSSQLRLCETVHHKNTAIRAMDATVLFLLLCLLYYRLLSLKDHGFASPWFLAFLSESGFTFLWFLIANMKWSPLTYRTYTQRLREQVPAPELPSVDMFVTTADPKLEPPIITINTVLSLLAVEYPAHKIACYVSDDGCSPLTFYSLVEASKFAKLWIPFCKKYNVQIRAPFRYFSVESAEPSRTSSLEFQQDWKKMKEEYEKLSQNIQDAVKNPASIDLTGELAFFTGTERKDHAAFVKVILENKEELSDGIPHLIYISREKRPKHQHHYKAGAINALTRVSGLLTNAQYMLNVDCDMHVNNPEVVLHAVCLFLDSANERDCGFVQFPQSFYDGPADWMVIWQETVVRGIVGIQGPFYQGTGAFQRRKVIYGLGPHESADHEKFLNSIDGKWADDELAKEFGNAKEFIKSVVQAFEGKSKSLTSNLSSSLEVAHQVAGCCYEYGSSWGEKIGLLYGTTSEDALTGLLIHSKGWRSGYCTPNPRAFLGCSPSGPAMMKQQKRWAMGLFQIMFSKHNPILYTLKGKLQFRQCLVYLRLLTWGTRSIPELCYVVLPAYCIITNSSFLPKFQEPGMCIPVALIVIYKLYTLADYIRFGFSVLSWWVDNCVSTIVATSAMLFGVVNTMSKLVGLSEAEAVFEVTQKVDQSSATTSSDAGKDDGQESMFDDSPYFIPGTTIVLIHLAALAIRLLGMHPQAEEGSGSGLGEYIVSAYVLLCFLPFLQGLFRVGKNGIPLLTICKSAGLALLFLQFCRISSRN